MNAFNVQITIQYRLNMYRFGSLSFHLQEKLYKQKVIVKASLSITITRCASHYLISKACQSMSKQSWAICIQNASIRY